MRSRLLEQFLGEEGEIDAPVAPDVAAVGFIVFARVAVGVTVVLQDEGVALNAIGTAHGNPEELGLRGELGGELGIVVPGRDGDAGELAHIPEGAGITAGEAG